MPLRVLVLSSEFPPGPGGIGTHAHQLALQLGRRGWDVTVAASQELATETEIQAFNAAAPFEVVRFKRFGNAPLKLAYRFAVASRLVQRIQPTLVVASGERMVWLAALLSRSRGVPFVAIGHALEFNAPAAWQRRVNKAAFESAAGVVCVSRYTQARMVSAGIRARVGTVIPNGADDSRFRSLPPDEAHAFRRQHGLVDATILITVGSVHERKGQDVVIRALPRVLERFPDVHYVMLGQPFRRPQFAELAAALRVTDRVHFLGAVSPSTVVQALNAADLFVMASQHTPNGDFEGFGIAVVEAALCGRPAVVSDNSGVAESIEPGETGLVAAVSDPDSLAERILELLADRARLDRMGRLAHERATANKTWHRRGSEYDRWLRRIATSLPPGPPS